jgi:hypothetical protein
MSTPTKAKSTKFTKIYAGSTDSPAGFLKIGEVKSFDGPNGTAPQIDASNFDSPEAEFVPGLSMPGELQMSGNFVGCDAGQQQLDQDRVDGISRYYKLELADHATSPTTYTFLAAVTSFSLSGQTNGIYDFKTTLKISGQVVKTYRPS